MGSGGGAWVAAATAGVGADEDVIHMGRLLMTGKRLGGPLVVVWCVRAAERAGGL